jgi:hypothetical protein
VVRAEGVPSPGAARQRRLEAVSDDELLRRARTDVDAFGLFFDRYVARVLRYFMGAIGNHTVATDLTAETFAQALVSLERFRGHGVDSGAAWLYGIARRLLLRFLRDQRREVSARRRLQMPVDSDAWDEAHAPRSAGRWPTRSRRSRRIRPRRFDFAWSINSTTPRSGRRLAVRASRLASASRAVCASSSYDSKKRSMADVDAQLAVVRTQILDTAGRRLADRARARRRGWLVVALVVLALGGGTIAVAAGVFDDGSAKLISRDFRRMAALSPRRARLIPTVVPGRTIHAFTKAAFGFDVDIVPTSDGGLCMVLRHATAVLGTEHAETCGTRAQTRHTDRPMMAIIASDGSGAAFGVAPAGATSGVFTIRGRALPLRLRYGYWAVKFPKAAKKPADQFAATRAVGRGQASFR